MPLSPIVHWDLHIRCKRRQSSRTCLTFGGSLSLSISFPSQHEREHRTERRCRFGWGSSRNGEKIGFRLQDGKGFLRHLLRSHVPTTLCAEGVIKDLTDMLARSCAYPVAYGGFSDIWRCQLEERRLLPKRVAVKAVRSLIANEEEYQVKKQAVEHELRVWMKLVHRNILPLYGITHGFGCFLAFVCPWADNGTLSEYLEKFETQLDMKTRMALLGDVAAGLRYMHSLDVVHGDLSGTNVLITEHGRACLSDFGLSTFIEQVSDTTVSGIPFPGNVRWAAPELFDECPKDGSVLQLSSQQTDVYSFGSVMLQTLTGKLPFHEVQRVAQIVIMISRGRRPQREPRWDGNAIPEVLWDFVQTCWANPRERPSSIMIEDFIRDQVSTESWTHDT